MTEIIPFIRRNRYLARANRAACRADCDWCSDSDRCLYPDADDPAVAMVFDSICDTLAGDERAVAKLEAAGLDRIQARAAIGALLRHMRDEG
ncbi:MAG: hypothetical protein ACFCVH_02500 [Alphaproteobacteria bacterium]